MIIPVAQWEASGIEVFHNDADTAVGVGDIGEERVVLDLHVGNAYYDPGPRAARTIGPGQSLKLPPGKTIRIRTRQRFTIADGVFGQVCSRSSLTANGLIVAPIKVDPMFTGHLQVTVFNASGSTVSVPTEDGFCSIFFSKLSANVGGRNRLAPEAPALRGSAWGEFIRRNQRALVVSIFTFVLSVAASIVAAQIVAEPHATPPPATVVETTTTIP